MYEYFIFIIGQYTLNPLIVPPFISKWRWFFIGGTITSIQVYEIL